MPGVLLDVVHVLAIPARTGLRKHESMLRATRTEL